MQTTTKGMPGKRLGPILLPESKGGGIVVSGFVDDCNGFLRLMEEEFLLVMILSKKHVVSHLMVQMQVIGMATNFS